MPAGLIPDALAQSDEPFEIPGKEGLVILNDRPVNAETPLYRNRRHSCSLAVMTHIRPFKMARLEHILTRIWSVPLYERLVAAGKPKKVAIVACTRKQLTVLNTMMKNGTHWDEKLA